ncbi:DNA repair protein rhp26 [Saitoella coloradoensis]
MENEGPAESVKEMDEKEKPAGVAVVDESMQTTYAMAHPTGEASLDALGVNILDQDTLEHNIAIAADAELTKRENEADKKRLEKTQKDKAKIQDKIVQLNDRINAYNATLTQKQQLRTQVREAEEQIEALDRDLVDIRGRIDEREAKQDDAADAVAAGDQRLPTETEREYLIRTGKITPFAAIPGLEQQRSEVGPGVMSHQNLRMPGFATDSADVSEVESLMERATPRKKRRLIRKASIEDVDVDVGDDDEDAYAPSDVAGSGEDDEEIDAFNDGDEEGHEVKSRKRKAKDKEPAKTEDLSPVDDGDEITYQERLEGWVRKRSSARLKAHPDEPPPEGEDEWHLPHPKIPDFTLNGGYRLPGDIYPSLFDYQKTCVQWLWELHTQGAGGIIGDEMGLGKTVQIISFLAGLHYSGKLNKPILVVCPATVMKMWCNEFRRWWPPLRVCILHGSGSGMLNVREEEATEKAFEKEHPRKGGPGAKLKAGARNMVRRVFASGHVIITTYAGLHSYGDLLLGEEWDYCVLDEGHKIRNPDAEISLACKQVKTVHRIILSGTPIQNNLNELWSLFDFVFPGRLGTLPVFQQQFAIPINMGGYANATNVQVQTAYKCACVLRDLINPYLLRRMKADVAADLPKRTEQVLFCKLTAAQRTAYEEFIGGNDMESIFQGRRQVLYGVDILRKICNHPDLASRDTLEHKPGYDYGDPKKSGKMQVVKATLELFRSQGHRTLLFSQTRQMLDILEKFVKKLDGINYLRMDGNTPVQRRQALVDQYNENPNIDVFLLTTKVGGLGINLTGANRVIIYDPDWNPSTDAQARERAWRLGQKREVIIFRLMTSGTIEEKIYHRQIFKQFLTNKILRDPKQRRFFKSNDLHDLFSLGSAVEKTTETGDLFAGTEVQLKRTKKKKRDREAEELKKLDDVAGLEQYQNEEERDAEKGDDDSRTLEGLLAGAGVQTALHHEKIMDAARPEAVLVDREATRVAEAAARALRESRRQAQRAELGTPTWTGRSGGFTRGSGANTPNTPRFGAVTGGSGARFGPAAAPNGGGRFGAAANGVRAAATPPADSQNLLAGLRQRQGLENEDANGGGEELDKLSDEGRLHLIKRLQEFILEAGGKATSGEIVRNFKIKVSGQQQVVEFRKMLKSIAEFREGAWVLKEEFR